MFACWALLFDYRDKVNNTYLHTYVAYLVWNGMLHSTFRAAWWQAVEKIQTGLLTRNGNTKMGTKHISFCDAASRGVSYMLKA